jgi:hypothetical protein
MSLPDTIPKLLDHVVDVAAIVGVVVIAVTQGTVSQQTLVSLTSIAIGKRLIEK